MKESVYSSEIYQGIKAGFGYEKNIIENTYEVMKPIFAIIWFKMIQNIRDVSKY